MRWSVLLLALGMACDPAPSGVQVAPAIHEEVVLPTLASWRDGPSRTAILDFVDRVTDPDSPDFVPASERIATFDNDGTLWTEQPFYTQLAFTLDRVKAMAPDHPEWATEQPFQAVLEGDQAGIAAAGMSGMLKMVAVTHGNLTTDEFEAAAAQWLATAHHPESGRLYTEMVYAPMLELMDVLRAHDFRVFIVSGGGAGFMRPFSEEVYGIPREHVVGTRFEAKYADGVVRREPRISFVDDEAGKPVGIYEHIGRRPIFAAGNSDGDLQMLQWTTNGDGPRFAMIVHHTDDVREVAYDRTSHIGTLDVALDEAATRGWTVVDMKKEWTRLYPFEASAGSAPTAP